MRRSQPVSSSPSWSREQRDGVLERIFVTSMALALAAFFFWFWVLQGPGPDIAPLREGVPGAR
jgi:hypothetical protein